MKACMGHLRDLPQEQAGHRSWSTISSRIMCPSRAKRKSSSEVCSEVRQGERHRLSRNRPGPRGRGDLVAPQGAARTARTSNARRVTFNEITKKVVSARASHARASIDHEPGRRAAGAPRPRPHRRLSSSRRSCGRRSRRGLSAGRVQSRRDASGRRARKRDRARSCPRNTGRSTRSCSTSRGRRDVHRALLRHGAARSSSLQPRGEVDARHALTRKSAAFAVKSVKRAGQAAHALRPPFITSTLQQEASRKLNMTPRRTMAIAQQLYEGVDVARRGHRGPDHLYAYRLAARLAEEAHRRRAELHPAAATARTIIPPRRRALYKTKSRRAGRARGHPSLQRGASRPSSLKGDLTAEQYKPVPPHLDAASSPARWRTPSTTASPSRSPAGVHEFRASASSLEVLRATPPCMRKAATMTRRKRPPPLPPLTEGQTLELRGLRRRSSTSPSPPRATPTRRSSARWSRTASAAPRPTRRRSRPSSTVSMSSRRANSCASTPLGERRDRS